MDSKVTILGHPVHPMLVAFPIGFYGGTLGGFVIYCITKHIFWFQLGIALNLAGVISAAVAAIPGLIDWIYLPANSGAKTTGSMHMFLNVTALSIFATNAFLEFPKWNDAAPASALPIILSASGMLTTIGAGFLGWKMIATHHVGIDETGLNG
jgi:uncharacterized membrane protein